MAAASRVPGGNHEAVIAHALARARVDHADDVDLVVGYGSWFNGDAEAQSDVDLYFVPAADTGWSMGETFMLDGVGYDIFGLPWSRLEAMARLTDTLTPLLGSATVLHARSSEAMARFATLRSDLRSALDDPRVTTATARRWFAEAAALADRLKGDLPWHVAREVAADVLEHLARAVTVWQGRYFTRGLKHLHHDLRALPELPTAFLDLFDEVVVARSSEKLIAATTELVASTRTFLGAAPPIETSPHGATAVSRWASSSHHSTRLRRPTGTKSSARRSPRSSGAPLAATGAWRS